MATEPQNISKVVKEYLALDKELSDASKVMSELRKKRKEREGEILDWMQRNDAVSAQTKTGGGVERYVKIRKNAVNRERVEEVATSFIGNEDRAAEFLSLVYDNRPITEEIALRTLKPPKGNAKGISGRKVDV